MLTAIAAKPGRFGKYSPVVCRGIYSLVSLEADAAQPIPALPGIGLKAASPSTGAEQHCGWADSGAGRAFHPLPSLSGGLAVPVLPY
jgi:hypothetical protein